MKPTAVTVLALVLIGCLVFGAYLLTFDPYIRLFP